MSVVVEPSSPFPASVGAASRVKRSSARAAFTLIELLVVMGILAVLIAVLLPALIGARRQAERLRCLSNMRELGLATIQYGHDNNGHWPPYSHGWGTPLRSKRWHDFLGKYVVGRVVVDVAGVPTFGDLNPTGTNDPFIEPQIWSDEIRQGNNALWGCPSWRRVNYVGSMPVYNNGLSPGYGWSRYFALCDLNDAKTAVKPDLQSMVITTSVTTSGVYPKAVDYKRPAERALLMDSVFGLIQTFGITGMKWKYAPEGSVPFPSRPDTTLFSIDFDRHGKRPSGNGPNERSLNILYADGHAAPASAREAWHAMRLD